MKKITHTPFIITSFLFLFGQPLQAAQISSTTSGADTIDTVYTSDYRPISEKGVNRFEEYLLMLQKKCVETATVQNGITLIMGTTGSGKSTITCDLLGVPLVGIRNNKEDDDSDWDDSDQEGNEGEKSASYTAIDIDPTYKPEFPLPTIGHDLSQSQTFFPALFSNPKAKDRLHYCDMPGFHDRRGDKEAAIASIAPALILHSTKKIKAILAILSYDNITCSRGEKCMEVIADIMTYFKHAPWEAIKEVTFICITKCAHVQNSDVVKAIKNCIRTVDKKLTENLQKYNEAVEELGAHNLNKKALDENKKNEYEKVVSDYEVLKTQQKFFTIFSERDPKTKKIKCDKKKLLFSKPLHKQKDEYRVKIIEALKSSPGLKKAHLSACDYSNPTLSHQLNDVVDRMSSFLSERENLKTQNRDLQKSISNPKKIPQEIKALQNKINDTKKEIEKEKSNGSLVPIYSPPVYKRTFSLSKTLTETGSALVDTIFSGISHDARVAGSTGLLNFFNPNKKFNYETYEPVYKMRVTYGPGTFKSTSPNGWDISKESANGTDKFSYEPTSIRRKYPVSYTFEYTGYFYTDGTCTLTLFSKYNELKTTKNEIANLESSVDTMNETIEELTKDKENQEKKIISNKEKIDQLDQCIINTYKKRGKNQGIAYCLSKCEMLEFFLNKPLFNANAAVQMNDDNDEKDDEKEEKKEDKKTEMDHPLKANMQRCIKQWRQWLKENSDKK